MKPQTKPFLLLLPSRLGNTCICLRCRERSSLESRASSRCDERTSSCKSYSWHRSCGRHRSCWSLLSSRVASCPRRRLILIGTRVSNVEEFQRFCEPSHLYVFFSKTKWNPNINVLGANSLFGKGFIDNCYRTAEQNQSARLAFNKLFSLFDLYSRTLVHLIAFSRPIGRNPGRCQNWECAKERNCAQYQILTSIKTIVPLTEGFWNRFSHVLMSLTDQLKFLDLYSVRTRGLGSSEETNSRFISL